MAVFTLPKNSKIGQGKTYKAAPGATRSSDMPRPRLAASPAHIRSAQACATDWLMPGGR